MRLRRALLAVLLAPAVAGAAPGYAVAPAASPTRGGAAVLPASGTRMTPDAAAKIPDARKLEISEQKLKELKKNVEHVSGQSEQARREKDVGKLNCLNVQLTQMRALQKVGQAAAEALLDAVGKADSAAASAHFARVYIAADKVQRMGAEAEICLGQLAYLTDGRTSVDVDQPDGLPERDVTLRRPMGAPQAAPPIVRPRGASVFYEP